MRVDLPPMRPMEIDPSFVPYLKGVIASRPIPISQENVQERRARMSELRRADSSVSPSDVTIDNLTIPTPDREIPVRIYRPVDNSMVRPCIVYFHGGGWVYGSPEQSDPTAMAFCRATGSVVVSPKYRLSPEHPFPSGFEDCYATLCWAASGASEVGADGARIAVTGESSGGNLAAACAIAARDRGGPAIALQVLNYPALDNDFGTRSYRENAAAPVLSSEEMTYFWTAYLAEDPGTNDPLAIPLKAKDLGRLPPALIVTAEYDPLRDDGIAYAERLSAAGTVVEHHNAPRLTHGFMRAWSISEDVQALADKMCSVFRQAFRV